MVELSRLEVWPAAWWQKTSGSLAGNRWLWQRPSGGRQLMSTTHGLGQSGTLCLRFWFRRCGTHGLMFKQLRFRSRLPGTHWLWCRLRWQVSFRLGLQRTHRFKQRSCGSSVQFRQAPVQTGPIACRQSGSGGLAASSSNRAGTMKRKNVLWKTNLLSKPFIVTNVSTWVNFNCSVFFSIVSVLWQD